MHSFDNNSVMIIIKRKMTILRSNFLKMTGGLVAFEYSGGLHFSCIIYTRR